MKKAVLFLLGVTLFVSACATPTVQTTPTPDVRPTVTPLGTTPVGTASTNVPPTEPADLFPLPTPNNNSPLGTPLPESPLATPSGAARTLTVLTHESFALSDAVL